MTITSIFKYAKLALWLKGGGDDEPKLSTVACISSMAPAYSAALQQMGIAQNTPAHISDFDTAPCPSDTFNGNWVIYPGKTRFYLSTDIMRDLQKLYILVKGKKKIHQITAEKAYFILVDIVIKYDFLQIMTLSIANTN